ncbi:hypothetical protein PRZ48_014206 [Zasmidium cellare]|uniref:Rhodopsin domain-containing protein n=1 Tax=Zasmidium cellare TaxID=395010 RepID=A0ABR0E0A3_ZASCE|nr:hypothetical protein PRZ48_014206 [Zasmidium cellare]
MVEQVKYGMGRHASTLTADDKIRSLIWFWISIWVYYLALGFAKLSILLQYMRIFENIPKFKVACWTVIAVVAIFTLWTFFTAMFLCQPIHHFWNPDGPGKCLNKLVLWFFNSSFNIVTDIATAILPLPVLKSLNLPRKQRYMLMGVLSLGGAVCVISIVRFHSLYAIAISEDPSWDNPLAALWATLEVNVGIIASCLPTLKGLCIRYFPKLLSITAPSQEPATTLELSGPGKSDANCSSNRSLSHGWKYGHMSRLGRRFGGVRIQEIDNESQRSQNDHISSPVDIKDGIKVTTVVEQVERRKEDGRPSDESRENLVPLSPRERT